MSRGQAADVTQQIRQEKKKYNNMIISPSDPKGGGLKILLIYIEELDMARDKEKWFKFYCDFFDDPKIKILDALANGP